MRQTIVNRLQKSYRDAVHVIVNREVDAETLVSAVETAKSHLETDFSIIDLLLVALSDTLTIVIYGKIETGIEPTINAIGTVIVVFSLVIAAAAEKLSSRVIK